MAYACSYREKQSWVFFIDKDIKEIQINFEVFTVLEYKSFFKWHIFLVGYFQTVPQMSQQWLEVCKEFYFTALNFLSAFQNAMCKQN